MSTTRETGGAFGLTPTPGPRHLAEREPSRIGRGLRRTLPFVLASAMTVTFNLTGPFDPVNASPKRPSKPKADLAGSLRGFIASATTAATAADSPRAHTVSAGDTVASIAGRYGISTASLLAVNGLGWKSLIFPGQVLKLSAAPAPAPATPPPASEGSRYTIQKGDTISRIAARFGVSTQAVLSANGLGWTSIIYPGQTLAIPAEGVGASPEAPTRVPLAVENVSAVTPTERAPAPAPEPAPRPAPPAATSTYVIQSGDTISGIAGRFGISTQALLTANGLTASSMIYAGRTLVIPAAGASSGSGSSPAGSVTPLTETMAANARIIIEVGRSLGVPEYGIIIALATAMQESSLRNIDWGDRDSVGLFQQRPSTGWGTAAEIMDPRHATYLFFHGRAGYTRGLLDIAGWQSMALTVAAQKVQISAYPDAYAKWETSARAWFSQLG
jgi:LysM repeat protein